MTTLIPPAGLKARGITYSRQHIANLEKDGKFPKRVRIGARIAWVETEIEAWLQERIAARDAAE